MTYTPEQLQNMREWVAIEVMKLIPHRNHYGTAEGNNWRTVCLVEDFKPDEDANQMLMALDTFHDVSIDKTIDMWAVTIWNHPEIGDEWKSGYHKSLGLAALVAMCRASGMPE